MRVPIEGGVGNPGSLLPYPSSRAEVPTAVNMASYQPPMRVWCMRSLKVSVPVTERTTPNTARSARSGAAPPWKGPSPTARTHSSASCAREVVNEGWNKEEKGGNG